MQNVCVHKLHSHCDLSLSLFIPSSGVCISALYKLDPLPLFQASLVLLLSSHLMSSV